jgi:hypothetical protein
MNKKNITIAIIVIILIAATLYFIKKPTVIEGQVFTDYKTGVYVIDREAIVLGTKGTTYFGNEAKGDINKDGIDDVAFLITDQSGGSGTFYYVVAALGTSDGKFVGTNAKLLGDRIAPQSTWIDEGDIAVSYADRAEGEPFTTAPSQGITNYYRDLAGNLFLLGQR